MHEPQLCLWQNSHGVDSGDDSHWFCVVSPLIFLEQTGDGCPSRPIWFGDIAGRDQQVVLPAPSARTPSLRHWIHFRIVPFRFSLSRSGLEPLEEIAWLVQWLDFGETENFWVGPVVLSGACLTAIATVFAITATGVVIHLVHMLV